MSNRTTKPLSRAQMREALQSVPDSDIYGAKVSRELTPKQKRFARALAEGKTKADAYRESYNVTSPHSIASDPYRIAANPRVIQEREAIERAMEAARHRTPAALRELVIQSLVEVLTDQDAAPAVRVSAARVLGTVTEVAAFTERKEVRTITSSEDAKRKVLGQLRELMNSTATDATIVDTQADALLAELRTTESANPDPHPPGTPHDAQRDSDAGTHTIPSELSPESADPLPEKFSGAADPTPSAQETPPGDGT